MLAVTHLIVSLLLIYLLTLDRNDAFIALLFGVFIDLDHLFGLKEYAEARGIEALFDVEALSNPGGQWKSMMHSPIAVMVVGPVATASRLAIPLIFWGMHVLMDYVQDALLGILSFPEIALLVSASALLIGLRYRDARAGSPGITFGRFFRLEMAGIRRIFPRALG